jgi:hypothetical protein
MKKMIPYGIGLLILLIMVAASIFKFKTQNTKVKPNKEEVVIIENYKGNVVTEKDYDWSEYKKRTIYFFQIKVIVNGKALGYEEICVTEYDYKKYDLGDTL